MHAGDSASCPCVTPDTLKASWEKNIFTSQREHDYTFLKPRLNKILLFWEPHPSVLWCASQTDLSHQDRGHTSHAMGNINDPAREKKTPFDICVQPFLLYLSCADKETVDAHFGGALLVLVLVTGCSLLQRSRPFNVNQISRRCMQLNKWPTSVQGIDTECTGSAPHPQACSTVLFYVLHSSPAEPTLCMRYVFCSFWKEEVKMHTGLYPSPLPAAAGNQHHTTSHGRIYLKTQQASSSIFLLWAGEGWEGPYWGEDRVAFIVVVLQS